MKALSTFLKVLTCAAAAVTLALFFFKFVTIGDYYSLTGFEASFHSKQVVDGNTITTYRSAWYCFAFILSALSLVCAGLNFKFKNSKFASAGVSLVLAINMAILYLTGSIQNYLDIRPLVKISNSIITKEIFFLLAFVLSVAALIISVISMFVSDHVEVMESNGARLSVLKRIKHFFKDYKSEITKIVWPSRKTVMKNVAVVLAMCIIVGAYIWVLDFGLSKLLGLILGI